jgi:hypothetical protein
MKAAPMSELSLVKLIAVNWSFHEQFDLPVTGTSAFIGDNGTGKSALLDMIQVAYAGGKPAGVRLNPGAQKSQKGGRTIGEYALGAVETRFLRDSAICYIALAFDGDNRCYTIGLAITATKGSAAHPYDIVDRFIAPGVVLDSSDFLDGTGTPRPWAAQKAVLEEKCKSHIGPGRRRGLACYPRNGHEYLLDHLSLASEGRFSHEPGDLLRAMSNALAFKDQIDSAGTFVKTFLLNADPIDVNRIRRSANDYAQINKDIERLEVELDLVKRMRDAGHAYMRAIENRDLAYAARSRARTLHALSALRQHRLVVKYRTTEREADLRESQAYADLIQEADAELDRLNAIHNQSTAAARLKMAKSDHILLLEQKKNAQEALKPYGSIRRCAADLLPVVLAAGLPGASEIKAVTELSADPTDDPVLAGVTILELAEILKETHAKLGELDLQLAGKADTARREADDKQKAADVARRTGRGISPEAEDLVHELKAKGMSPRLVCSVIEVTDPEWLDAAEARLGRDREAVIVDPQHCRDAILYYRNNRSRFQKRCSVVNTAKDRFLDGTAERNSLASVIATKDRLARAFIDRRLGRIRLALDQQELERPGAAIMKDCTYDDGLVVRTLELDHHKIGAAGANAVAQLADAAARALTATREAEANGRVVRAAHMRASEIITILDSGYDITKLAEIAVALSEKIEISTNNLRALEQDGDTEMLEKIDQAKQELQRLRGESRDLDIKIERLKNTIDAAIAIINSADAGTEGSRAMALAAYAQYLKDRPFILWHRFRPYFADLVKVAPNNYKNAADRADRRYNDNNELQKDKYFEFQELLGAHKTAHDGARDFTREDSIPVKVMPWVEGRITAIETTDLISRRAELAAAADQIRHLLQEDFIHRVADRAKLVKNTIREINRILEDYEFHREVYSFTYEMDPHYAPIVEFAERANSDETFLDRVIHGQGHGPDREILERIRSLVLGQEDVTPNEEEIEKLADYRNWYKFGLMMVNPKTGSKTPFDHRIVKGSGGEIQAPFYIIMAVAISAIHHGRARAQRRYAGPVLLDEAFSKLSPANAKSCIDFFKNVGLQVIMAAPRTSRAVLDACCNTIVDLIRYNDDVYADSMTVGDRLREETLAADPDRYSMEELRQFVEQKMPQQPAPGAQPAPERPANTDESSADVAAE